MKRAMVEHRVVPSNGAGVVRLVEASQDLTTPFLLIDQTHLRWNVRKFHAAFPGAGIFYAVKANAHPGVIRTLAEEGCGFEISSDGELDLVNAAGRGGALLSSNPIKAPSFIRRAAEAGVTAFAVDSIDELLKIAGEAPGVAVYVRLLVDNEGSEWPLTRKYGVGPTEAVDLLVQAAGLGLTPLGTTFHVGSQCRLSASWDAALALTADVWNHARRRDIRLSFLSIGGGFPVHHTREIPALAEIGDVVRRAIADRFPPDAQLTLEPGRAIVGDAALLGASVIGKARRGDEQWVYLDVGVFNGLMETIGGFSYEVATRVDGPRSKVVLAGPSCDSVDVIGESIELPDLNVGDRVYFVNAGAYTLAYAAHFNGWPPPSVHFVRGAD